MKNKKNSNLLKKSLILIFAIYFIYTLIAQQKTLNSYAREKERYNEQIEVAEDEQEELQEMKENINSDEYIEQIGSALGSVVTAANDIYTALEKLTQSSYTQSEEQVSAEYGSSNIQADIEGQLGDMKWNG